MHVQRHNHNNQIHHNRVDGYNPRTEGFDPKKFKLPSEDFTPTPLPHLERNQDGVRLSSEAEQLAAVDPGVCNNDWRCLQSLDQRGLLV